MGMPYGKPECYFFILREDGIMSIHTVWDSSIRPEEVAEGNCGETGQGPDGRLHLRRESPGAGGGGLAYSGGMPHAIGEGITMLENYGAI